MRTNLSEPISISNLPYMMTIADIVRVFRVSDSRSREYIAAGKFKATRLPGRKFRGKAHNPRRLLVYTDSIIKTLKENDLDVPETI